MLSEPSSLLSNSFLALIFLALLACIFPADSGAFIIALPSGYYVYKRIICAKLSARNRRGLVISGAILVALLFLPPVRRTVAGGYLRLFEYQYSRRCYQQASHSLTRARQWDDDHPFLLYQRSRIAESSGDIEEAIHFLEKAIEEGYDAPDAVESLAYLRRESEQASKRRQCLFEEEP